MPRGVMQQRYCTVHGCGMPFKFKRALSSQALAEATKHRESGECAERVIAFKKREAEERMTSNLSLNDLERRLSVFKGDFYREIGYVNQKLESLRLRVERRIEGRRTYKERNARASLPKPWDMDDPIKGLAEAGIPVAEKFKEIILKPTENWCWQGALGEWFHFLLDACSADPIMVRHHNNIHFYEFGVPKQMSYVEFFPCFRKRRKGDWDRTAVEGGFFGTFWLMHAYALRKMFHWENRILFELRNTVKATARSIRMFEQVMPECPFDTKPNLPQDCALAEVFFQVLSKRREARKLNPVEEVYEADLEEKFSEK